MQEIMNYVLSVLTIICGGGWFVNRQENKRRAKGEAVQAEADGWKSQQEVYQTTINDLKESCEFIRKDRDLLRKENEQLRNENVMMREKIFELEKQMSDLRRDLARQGRRIESLTNKNKKGQKEN